jgi:AAA domain
VEVAAVTKRVRSGLELLGREYDPTTRTVPPWLAQAQGAHPILRLTGFGCGWCVQARPDGRKAVAANKQRKASGRLADLGEPSNEQPPKKYRFPLLRFGEMRPATEPDYLVDELIPMEGLVVVYGAPKSGKSLWVLDLALHIALAWEYRDRAVQQGTVIYCAFEGAHGYRKRCEAFRRCHGLTDEDPPLYVVPGRADLIKDHSALIKDMHGQSGASATTVRCVVLDTLYKSLIGSESKDVDMANYIAAAEAIQATFNCVVIIVHHHGIDESRPRGHTSLRGAVAAQIKITRDEQNNIIAEIEDMRDGPDGAQILSRLAVVDVGTDVAGKPLTSAAVEPIETGVGAGGRKLPKLTKNQRTFFSILQNVAAGLTADECYEQARQAGLGAKRRADLHDLRSSLKNRGLVQQTEDRWFVAAEYRRCSD